MIQAIDNIMENTWFLVAETQEQVRLTRALLDEFDEDRLKRIAAKDDYVDHLKTTVENLCFSRIHGQKQMAPEQIRIVRALHVICVNLERIADYCVNIARQIHYLTDRTFIHAYDYGNIFTKIQVGLERIAGVLRQRDLSGALDICRIEYTLDCLYKATFDRVMSEIKSGHHVGDLMTVIFIFRYLERIGDSLLNIGEALIFAIIGDRIKIRHFKALRKTLSESGFDGNLTDIDFNSIWGSRSGCRIVRVGDKRPDRPKAQGIFKEGIKKKIRLEQENIRRWESIYPGLVPRIFGYYEKFDTASMLIEFLTGCTLEQIILTETDEIFQNVVFVFEQVMDDIWNTTLKPAPAETDYMKQFASRLQAVRRVHPGLVRRAGGLNDLPIAGTEALIDACRRLEADLPAPFTIFIHGDFNVNNIVYDHERQRVHYIDLYRSRDADYVQDASVFLLSNFRLPVFDESIRGRLNGLIAHFLKRFAAFARRHEDATFEARLTLALARSFFTSSRFEMNRRFAREMTLRSHYLMERFLAHEGRPWEDFRLPPGILIY